MAVGVLGASMPGASAQNYSNNGPQSRYSNHDQGGGVNQQSYVSNGNKHYWYNGQEWTMNLGTGERRQMSGNNGKFNNGQGNGQFNNGQGNGQFNNGQGNRGFNNGQGNRGFNNGQGNGRFNNGQGNRYDWQNGSQQSYISTGEKHYWYNGQEWVMDLQDGQRHRVFDTTNYSPYSGSNYKPYSFEGGSFVLNIATGERIRVR